MYQEQITEFRKMVKMQTFPHLLLVESLGSDINYVISKFLEELYGETEPEHRQLEYCAYGKKHNLNTGLRIGIGCGEVIAGIIGKNKFSYDLWGEAVNLASRMESHGLCNKIQVTESTYEITRSSFQFDKRDPIEAKGLGWINTYWLLSR